MSMNRDNFRANQPPSKVLHIRNIPPDATEADVLELCRPFGRIIRIKLSGGGVKAQAFVEYDNIRSAIQMISYFVGNADPPRVRNKSVYLQYSTRQDIGGGTLVAMPPPPPPTSAAPVLAVSMDCVNPSQGPSIENLHVMFSSFGEVAKIIISENKQNQTGMQVLIQMSDHRVTAEARAQLDGLQVPAYMVPSHGGPITMRVAHSPLPQLEVREQSSKARDFTNPYLPYQAASTAAPAAPAPSYEGMGESRMLLAMIDDVQYTPTIEALAQVFSVYGQLAKMTLINRAGYWQALVLYHDAAAAASAKQYLEGYAMYPGGANKLQLEFSVQQDMYVPANDENGWDWTRDPAAEAAAAAAAAAEQQQQAAAAAAEQQQQQAGGTDATGGTVAAAGGAEPCTAGAAGVHGASGTAAAGDGDKADGTVGHEGHLISGADYVQAHEIVARIAAEALGNSVKLV